jgi:hypothetical protein
MKPQTSDMDSGSRTPFGMTRRELVVAGGASLVMTLFPQAPALAQETPGTHRGKKPVFVPQADDAVAHSVADTLFWTDILAEHAVFFAMLMPGPELAGPRGRAEQFKATFTEQFEKTRAARLDQTNYVAHNKSTIEMVKPFIDFKREMQASQESGKLGSLVWPLFFDHTAREAERFVRRLGQLSKGEVKQDPAEVVGFWAQIMDEHSEFIAHLLDPQEDALIEKALSTSAAFRDLRTKKGMKAEATPLVTTIIDFKTAAAKGIETGKIKSIIPMALADHVRREAVKFDDELKRL